MGAESNSSARTDLRPKFKPQSQKPCKKAMNTPTNSLEMTPLKVMNTTENEWDQLDTQLAKYGQNQE
jgi:hypothetical protein